MLRVLLLTTTIYRKPPLHLNVELATNRYGFLKYAHPFSKMLFNSRVLALPQPRLSLRTPCYRSGDVTEWRTAGIFAMQ